MLRFNAYASLNAFAAGAAGLLYAVSFVILQNSLWSAIFLLLGGVLAVPVMVALFHKLRDVEPHFALAFLILGIFGAGGAAIHGAYDLANAISPPIWAIADVPNGIDPRGFLTFGVMGAAILKISWLLGKGDVFSKKFRLLGYVSGALLVIIYLARLIVLSPANPILLYPILLEGFVVNPLWYVWLGYLLKRE